jgi:hypothetical protein
MKCGKTRPKFGSADEAFPFKPFPSIHRSLQHCHSGAEPCADALMLLVSSLARGSNAHSQEVDTCHLMEDNRPDVVVIDS